MGKRVDITALLFEDKELSPEEKKIESRRLEIYSLAEKEAELKIKSSQIPFSPMNFLRETQKIYKQYLEKEGIPYQE